MALSRLPSARRRSFADAFYEERRSGPAWLVDDDRARLAIAAAVVLSAVDIVDDLVIDDGRTLDVMQGAAQGDDLTRMPAPAVAAVGKTIARLRCEFEHDDPADPRAVAALAVAEVLDPSSGVIDVKEVLARSTWAVVETLEPPGGLRFLIEVDHLLAEV
jgi:electron transfer flavoprotein alpha/beta subunit